MELFKISDFDPDEDILVIERQGADDGFTLTDTRLEVDEVATTFVLRFESEVELARELTIEIDASGFVRGGDFLFVDDTSA